ncbi:MAG TPA: WecB/TagA/CpsF family glycosyltransferase [Candidatus Woesebacteria bacterium]|nr:WecB/TagA/CpsF family glycosyltransferase [Candidatus Woesebacteria bacterium]
MTEVLKIVENWLESEAKSKWIATVNPEFVMEALKNDQFRQILSQTDLNVVDGVGLLWAREVKNGKSWFRAGMEIIKGKHREGLVSGSDLIPELCKLAIKKNYKVFFLGGFNDRAERTAKYFKLQMPGLKCQFSEGEPNIKNEEVLKKINEFKPDILFVAYGMKKQEEWIKNNRNKADFGVAIGVGRSFDYYSGDLKRAPKMVRKMGMEWLYSLVKEPKRFKRQLVLPKFMWKVLKG